MGGFLITVIKSLIVLSLGFKAFKDQGLRSQGLRCKEDPRNRTEQSPAESRLGPSLSALSPLPGSGAQAYLSKLSGQPQLCRVEGFWLRFSYKGLGFTV